MNRQKKIKRNFEVALASGLLGVARRLPRGAGFRLFSAMGGTAALFLRKDREAALRNLAVAFPDAAPLVREAMATAMFKALGKNVFEFLNLEGSTTERVISLVERVDGLDHLDRAYREGSGVLVITGHIGCWELLAAYVASLGYPVNVVGRALWEKRLNERLVRIRESLGVKTIDRDTGGKTMLRVLRNKEVIGVLMDQRTRVSGIYVPFFNRPAHTPTGIARMALATGARIVPMAIYMVRNGRHVIRVLPPVEFPAGNFSQGRKVEILTDRCSRLIEDLIRYDPKQWVWFHNRWGFEDKAEVGHAVLN